MDAAMHNAVVAVMESRLSVKKAAKTFNVPRTTLVGRLKIIDRPDLIKVQLNRDKLVDAAVEAVKSGRVPVLRAAKMYGVPERTVFHRMNGSQISALINLIFIFATRLIVIVYFCFSPSAVNECTVKIL